MPRMGATDEQAHGIDLETTLATDILQEALGLASEETSRNK